MNVTIHYIGELKESYLREAAAEYENQARLLLVLHLWHIDIHVKFGGVLGGIQVSLLFLCKYGGETDDECYCKYESTHGFAIFGLRLFGQAVGLHHEEWNHDGEEINPGPSVEHAFDQAIEK